MNAARNLRKARHSAGLSQRDLARLTGIAQPTIARIERGTEKPRVDTLDRLLRACGLRLGVLRAGGAGVDRSLVREMQSIPAAQRIARGALEAEALDEAIPRGILLRQRRGRSE